MCNDKNRFVGSTKITFQSEKELKNFDNLVNNPSEPNERVKRTMRKYKGFLDSIKTE